MKEIQIEVVESVYARLTMLATARGETVTDLLETSAYRMSRLNLATDEVGVLWAQGHTDAEIGRMLGWTNLRVSARRRALQLPANRPQPKRKRGNAA